MLWMQASGERRRPRRGHGHRPAHRGDEMLGAGAGAARLWNAQGREASTARRARATSASGGTAICCASCSTATPITKWDWQPSDDGHAAHAPTGCASNNGTKATPVPERRHPRRLARGGDLARRRQRGAAHLHDDDPDATSLLHADARPAVPAGDRLAERRLQPAAAPGLLPRRRDEPRRPRRTS